MRYAKSGSSDEALTIATGDVIELIAGGFTTNRVFRLRGLTLTNEHASEDAVVKLFDVGEGAQANDSNVKDSVIVPARTTVKVDYPAPGLLFSTNLTAGLEADTGTFGAYKQSAWGYEE